MSLFVCLSVRGQPITGTTRPKFADFSVHRLLYVAVAWSAGPPVAAMYFRFCGWRQLFT